MEYLIVVNYHSDAERKRIDYAIDRWKDKDTIKKPKGTVLYFNGEDIDDFLDDMYARIDGGRDSVQIFKGDTYAPEISAQTAELKYRTEITLSNVEYFLRYVLNRIGASPEGGHRGEVRAYSAYTKKGRVEIDTYIGEKNTETTITIIIRGYGDVVPFMKERIDRELRAFLDMKS